MNLDKLMAAVTAKRSEIEARKTAGTKMAKIPGGTSRWRILPGWREDDRETFSHDFGQHFIKDAAGKVTAVVVCDYQTFGNSCELDSLLRDAIRSTADDTQIKLLKDMGASKRVLVNAIQISGTGFEEKKGEPQLLPLPPGLFEKFISLMQTRFVDEINLLDLKEGRDVIINKTGAGLNTEYTLADAAKATAVDPAVMDKLTNIDAFIKGERDKGLQVGVKPLNEAIARIMGVSLPSSAGTGASRSLVAPGAAAAAAAALAPPPNAMDNTVVEDVPFETVTAPKTAPAPAAKPAPKTDFDAPLAADDLDELLKELS